MLPVRSQNDEQGELVRVLVATGSEDVAILATGYKGNGAKGGISRALRTPSAMLALQIELRRQIQRDAINARLTVRDIATNPAAAARPGAKVALDAAKTLLDRAGLTAPRESASTVEQPLNELTTGDLRAMADKLEGELASRAKHVPVPIPAPVEANDLDLIG